MHCTSHSSAAFILQFLNNILFAIPIIFFIVVLCNHFCYRVNCTLEICFKRIRDYFNYCTSILNQKSIRIIVICLGSPNFWVIFLFCGTKPAHKSWTLIKRYSIRKTIQWRIQNIDTNWIEMYKFWSKIVFSMSNLCRVNTACEHLIMCDNKCLNRVFFALFVSFFTFCV